MAKEKLSKPPKPTPVHTLRVRLVKQSKPAPKPKPKPKNVYVSVRSEREKRRPKATHVHSSVIVKATAEPQGGAARHVTVKATKEGRRPSGPEESVDANRTPHAHCKSRTFESKAATWREFATPLRKCNVLTGTTEPSSKESGRHRPNMLTSRHQLPFLRFLARAFPFNHVQKAPMTFSVTPKRPHGSTLRSSFQEFANQLTS